MAEFKTKFGIGDKVVRIGTINIYEIKSIELFQNAVWYKCENGSFSENAISLYIEPYKPKYRAGDVMRTDFGSDYRILNVIGENYVYEVLSIKESADISDDNYILVARNPKFKKGDRIKHKGWGVGTVTGYNSHRDGDNLYGVDYDDTDNCVDGVECQMSLFVDPTKPRFKVGGAVRVKAIDVIGKVVGYNENTKGYSVGRIAWTFSENDLEAA